MTRSMEKLTTSKEAGVQTWIPADSYANLLIQSGAKFGQLIGKISLMQYDMGAENGSIIQVKYVRPRLASARMNDDAGVSGNITPCLSVASTTLGTQSVTVYKYGDYDNLPGFTEFETSGNVRAAIMEEMSRGMGRRLDKEMWGAIKNAKPNGSGGPHNPHTGNHSHSFHSHASWSQKPAAQGSCCTYGFNLYNAVIEAQMHLRGDGMNPDFVVMHPTVAQYLYFREGGSYPDWTSTVKWDGQGVVKTINGMEVIECQHADAGSATSRATLCVILDSSAAIAEAWGKRPTFSSDYVPECDYTKEVLWAYWGCAAISGASVAGVANGIAHVINP